MKSLRVWRLVDRYGKSAYHDRLTHETQRQLKAQGVRMLRGTWVPDVWTQEKKRKEAS